MYNCAKEAAYEQYQRECAARKEDDGLVAREAGATSRPHAAAATKAPQDGGDPHHRRNAEIGEKAPRRPLDQPAKRGIPL